MRDLILLLSRPRLIDYLLTFEERVKGISRLLLKSEKEFYL